MSSIYAEKLSRMVGLETVSTWNDTDLTKFYDFHKLIEELFPDIFRTAEVKDFSGSLLLKWRGTDSGKQPVIFMNHHDVVEATGTWSHDPFGGEIIDGKLWGRGSLDTKSGVFGMLEAADELAAAGFIPSRDIYFITACNEETTGRGAEIITDYLEENGVHFEMSFDEGSMIVHDPLGCADGTFAMVAVGEKGACDMKFVAKSAGGHASTPPKDTPLVRLGRFITEVEDSDPFDKELSPVIKEALRRMAPYMAENRELMQSPDGREDEILSILPDMSPTAAAVTRTTLAFTMAKGSDGTNVLPQEAYIVGNMRYSHHEGREASIDKLRPFAEKYGIEIEIMDPGCASGVTDIDSEAFKLAEKAVNLAYPDIDAVVPFIMTGASDSRTISRICDQCIRFRPVLVDPQQAKSTHGLNENISVDALAPCVEYYKYIMKNV